MASEPLVTVIMATLNCREHIDEAARSVAGQSLDSWELLVMDSDSDDGTVDVVQAFQDPRMVVHQRSDEGVAHAWDRALQIARGTYVAFLCGNDGYLDNEWLATCVAIMERDSEVSLVWGIPTASYDGQVGGVAHWPWGAYAAEPDAINGVQKGKWLYNWLSTGAYFSDNNMCIRRSVMQWCMPRYSLGTRVIDKQFAFQYNFNALGFMPYGVPRIVSFGRLHAGQLGQTRMAERRLTVLDYLRKVRRYRASLLRGSTEHVYRDADGAVVGAAPAFEGRLNKDDFYVEALGGGRFIDGTRYVEELIQRARSGPPDATGLPADLA
jgi:glycosyltransferase involved in cell wall biosynthesis